MEQFKIIGYYICEITDTADWLHGFGPQVLSVSNCIGEQHPKWECFLGGWCKGESLEYQKALKLNDGQYQEFTETANRLFDRGQMDIDCRFYQLSDALALHRQFCTALPCRVVSISTTPEYFDVLAEELKGTHSSGRMNGETDNSSWLGSDILGWDFSGFHSFLCNALQEGLCGIKFNNMGLLDNDFCDVAHYAQQIKGFGEPVEWIPCRVGVYV